MFSEKKANKNKTKTTATKKPKQISLKKNLYCYLVKLKKIRSTLSYDQIVKKLGFSRTARLGLDPVTGRIGQEGGRKEKL